jgi:RNA polymerase sigma factor (sigma-70 family)
MLVLARPGPPSPDLDSITDPDDGPNPLEHMKLVWSIAIAYHGCGRRRGLDLEDLVQSGHIGLLRACKEFRPELGYKFSTYANYWIEHFIGRALQNAHGPLRVPVGLLDLMSAVRRKKVKEDDLTGKQKSRIADAERLLGSAVIHDPAVLADVVADRCQDEGRGEDAELARSLLGILPAREREVIAAHFGIGGGDPLPLAEVGARAGLSRSEAETAYRRGLKRIRSHLVAKGFMEARRRPPGRPRTPYGSKSPVRGVYRTPEGTFGVKISLGGNRVARGGTHATLDEARDVANALGRRFLGIDGYADRPARGYERT